MFYPYSFILTPSTIQFESQINSGVGSLDRSENYTKERLIDSSVISSQHWENSLQKGIQTISNNIMENSDRTNTIITLLDKLYKDFQSIEEEFNSILKAPESQEREPLVNSQTQDSESLEKMVISKVHNNRTHPKIKLMENIFGKKQYTYKLSYEGKFPKVLFKQRNISLKILLKNTLGQNVINGNPISLHLKIFKNNGQEIVSDCPDHSFMQGLCQTQIKNGMGVFSKIHPRQVSRGFSSKGVCIIIYATSQQNLANEQGLRIKASDIQPLIFYNIKVVVKQNKFSLKNHTQTTFEIGDY